MKPLLLVLFICASGTAFSQSSARFAITRSVVAGGGMTASSSARFQMAGTIGQAEASRGISGGNFWMSGGFWAQPPGPPLLTITNAYNQAIVSWWPWVTGWTLQTNVSLNTPNWGNYLGPVVKNSVTNAPIRGNLFFRLKQ